MKIVHTTRVCKLLGIKYPILQGGMLWVASAELAGAISNAGALGTISPYAGMEILGNPSENLRIQIGKARSITRMPFAVNIPIDMQQSGIFIDITLQEKVGIVVTSAGDPGIYTELLHEEGIKVLHVVSSVRQAQKAEQCHVDAVIAAGVESGARVGMDEIPSLSLIPQVVDAVSIPVIAAGGIVDARGMVAVFALGAEGVQLGTRFVAVEENIASSKYKKAIVEAKDTDTVITSRTFSPRRSLKTEFTRVLLKMEGGGASADEIQGFVGKGRARKGQLEGDLVEGEAYCGASAGLIKEILPAADVIRQLVDGYEEVLRRLDETLPLQV